MRRGIGVSALLGPVLAGMLAASAVAVNTSGFPEGSAGYHDYAEMEAELNGVVADHPAIAAKLAIGQSFEGRTIWAIKISDNVGVDENEPEVLFESLEHAREHLTVEMALRVVELLADNHRVDPADIRTPLEQRVTDLVNGREIWVIPMVNPDGAEYDISGDSFNSWRRNRQAISGSTEIGVDLNRNWGFKWGCCGGSSGQPGATTYGGQFAWQAPEVVALRNFVLGRIVGGRQQIKASISWHAFNEQVMWPYGYTRTDLPRTMTADDLLAMKTIGRGMADLNGYTAQQMSDLYLVDGGTSDWLYGDQRIFAYVIEMYPTAGSHVGGFYPPDDVIDRETTRNDEAVLYLLESADCPYREAGLGTTHCGPLNDDFETGRGWTVNPVGTDTATMGRWERAIAERTRNTAGIKQRPFGSSGRAALVTGALRGGSVSANDVDGGLTSVRSVAFKLGQAGSTGWTLSFDYTFAHNAKATAADYLRISIGGTEVFRQAGKSANRNAVWTAATANLDAWAGQSVRLLIEARDGASGSLIEAAIDDVRVYRQP